MLYGVVTVPGPTANRIVAMVLPMGGPWIVSAEDVWTLAEHEASKGYRLHVTPLDEAGVALLSKVPSTRLTHLPKH